MKDLKILEKRMFLFWQKHHEADVFLSRKIDKHGLDVVGVTGAPLVYNNFLYHFFKRLFSKALIKIGGVNDKLVLDVGCGTAFWTSHLNFLGAKVIGIDLSKERLEDNKKRYTNIDFSLMSVTSLGFKNNSFDIITSLTVLQHIPYLLQKKAIKEMASKLKKGGYILILEGIKEDEALKYKYSFPNSTRQWIELFSKEGLYLLYHDWIANLILLDFYFDLRNKLVDSVRSKFYKISQPKDAFDTIAFEKKWGNKDFCFLKKVYHLLNKSIICLVCYLSYFLEYLGVFKIIAKQPSFGVFLFQKNETFDYK